MEWIRTANDDKRVLPFRLDFGVTADAFILLGIDDQLLSNKGGVPPAWVTSLGFSDTGSNLTGTNPSTRPLSLFERASPFPGGSLVSFGANVDDPDADCRCSVFPCTPSRAACSQYVVLASDRPLAFNEAIELPTRVAGASVQRGSAILSSETFRVVPRFKPYEVWTPFVSLYRFLVSLF